MRPWALRNGMDKVREVFLAIRQDPASYLPERSVWALRDFLSGYSARVSMEGFDSEMSSIYRRFETWLGNHFNLLVQSQSVYQVVYSYSAGPEDALINFFILFEQFQTLLDIPADPIAERGADATKP